ncbi:hypothetical protein FGO68_gene1292 [Halteria grandinella]|uniref:Uncharacterized protein n=1 Tax=Halteria grandinella TaxID=5974 RepID=A0A8J8NXB9_HALGN|nr:hypothetical protein FGO68_gene1292 [Halteria grandinella]
MSNTNLISGKMIREKLTKLQNFSFKLIAPIKLPSEQSLFLYLLLKELCENPTLNKIVIESEYTLFPDQLKKAIGGGNLGTGERLWGLEIEYLGCKYGVEDQLELYKFLSLRYPWVKLTI